MKQHLLFTICLVSLLSCQTQEQEIFYSYGLKECKKITLPIDEDTYYMSKSIFQFEDGGREFLYFENTRKSLYNIVLFDLDKQVVSSKIDLHKEGPNGIPALYGSRPLIGNPRQFILSQNNIGRITRIDNEGRVLKNYNVRGPDGEFCVLRLSSHSCSPTFVRDSALYFGQGLVKPNMKKEEWDELPLFFSIDLRDGKFDRTSLCYPDIFDKDCKNVMTGHHFAYDYNYTDNRVVCSFVSCDSIMVSDDLKSVKWHYAKSKYLASMRPQLMESDGGVKSLVKYAEMPKYSRIIYDKYREVYYRFAQLPYELQPNETPFNLLGAEEFSVIVLDKDFKIIGETKFPGNKYFYQMSFVGRDGLYISENNLMNPDFDENKLVFACFDLKKME